MARRFAELNERLEQRGKLLESFSYNRVLDRGFALVQTGAGSPLPTPAGPTSRPREHTLPGRQRTGAGRSAGWQCGRHCEKLAVPPEIAADKDQGSLL